MHISTPSHRSTLDSPIFLIDLQIGLSLVIQWQVGSIITGGENPSPPVMTCKIHLYTSRLPKLTDKISHFDDNYINVEGPTIAEFGFLDFKIR